MAPRKPAPKKKTGGREKPELINRALISWKQAVSVIVSISTLFGFFWAIENRYINIPFFQSERKSIVQESQIYSKELDIKQQDNINALAQVIKDLQNDNKELKRGTTLALATQKQVSLLNREMSMREAMAKLKAENRYISPDFEEALKQVIADRKKADALVDELTCIK